MDEDAARRFGVTSLPASMQSEPKNSRSGIYRSFGRALREARQRRRMTQAQLAEAAKTHRNYVGAAERGELNPTLRLIVKLARGLQMQPSELFQLAERRHDWQEVDGDDVRTADLQMAAEPGSDDDSAAPAMGQR